MQQPNQKLISLCNNFAQTLYDWPQTLNQLKSILPGISITWESHGEIQEEPDYITITITEPRFKPGPLDIDKIYLYGLICLISEILTQDCKPIFTTQDTLTKTKRSTTYKIPCDYSS